MDRSRRRTLTLILSAFCLLAGSTEAFAAERIDLRRTTAAKQALNVRAASPGAERDALRAALRLEDGETLELESQVIDQLGLTHSRYRQQVKGVPVWGDRIHVTRDSRGDVKRLVGRQLRGAARDLGSAKPSFDATTALARSKALHTERHAGEQGLTIQRAQQALRFENESTELVVFVKDGTATLSYAVSFFVDSEEGGTPSRPTVLIDARDGSVLLEFEGLTHAMGTGAGGNERTGRYEYGVDLDPFEVSEVDGTCAMETPEVASMSLDHGSDGSCITSFRYGCYENTFKEINGAYSPINDAHAFGLAVFDMYSDWYGAAPLPFQLCMRVHYGTDYENAFWDGLSMTFGDGGPTFYPLVSLDIVSHEVSHGFTEHNSGLIYGGQSGGINEAFSDIAGEAAEFYFRGTNDWVVGGDIFRAPGQALRYMDDPTADGVSIDNANQYYEGLDVHYSSGVFNKAFFLLATTPGWDAQKAFDIFVRANQFYWTPSTGFVDGAAGVRDAAIDLGYEAEDVDAAFEAVGIGPQGLPPYVAVDASFAWVDMTSGTTLQLGDDEAAEIPIGFGFEFFDQTFDRVTVSSNGFLTFGGAGWEYLNERIPSSGDPNAVIAPYWDDLNPSMGGQVSYLLSGQAPARQLTVSWIDVPYYDGSGTVTFQATLVERRNRIQFRYLDVESGAIGDGGASATIGVEGPLGMAGLQYSFNSRSVSNGDALRIGRAGACADGVDNDGDGRVDHPQDPGCASKLDPSEQGGCGSVGIELALVWLAWPLARRRTPCAKGRD